MLTIIKQINIPSTATAGIDCLEYCLNKEHFRNYPKNIIYQYNSRGFRDAEWPNDLADVIWCVGDSATMGIGQPFEETWPQLLEKKTGKTCLNIGEQGCSNDTIALRTQEIYRLYKPKLIVVMWSYLSRRRVNDENVQYDENNFGVENDLINFAKNYKLVNDLPVDVIHLLVPNACLFGNNKLSDHLLEFNIKNVLFFPQLDHARDYHHFDLQTSNYVCDLILKKINEFDKNF
jgi:hypothetical protein